VDGIGQSVLITPPADSRAVHAVRPCEPGPPTPRCAVVTGIRTRDRHRIYACLIHRSRGLSTASRRSVVRTSLGSKRCDGAARRRPVDVSRSPAEAGIRSVGHWQASRVIGVPTDGTAPEVYLEGSQRDTHTHTHIPRSDARGIAEEERQGVPSLSNNFHSFHEKTPTQTSLIQGVVHAARIATRRGNLNDTIRDVPVADVGEV
jgi:hypothetical protein